MFKIKVKIFGSLTFFSILFFGCDNPFFGPSFLSKTIKFDGEKYEMYSPIPMAFNTDTIYPELWYRTFSVDGDVKRIMRFISKDSTTIVALPNGVNNYTDMTLYSLQLGNNRYLWIEDNFGTTVFDIDINKIVKVRNAKKKLIEIAPTGAPTGVIHQITTADMRHQLKIDSSRKIIILDSLKLEL